MPCGIFASGSQALQFSHIGAWPAKASRWLSATVSLASNIFLIALCHSAAILFAMALPASSSAAALRLAAVPRRPGQQKLRHGAPASNKPHPAEKGTPVWQPIWCTWAGFANSQLRCATFQSTYSYKCTSSLLPPWSRCSDRRKSIGPSAPIANATSVSPPNEAVAWPVAQVSDR